jgi:hypothetical protein
VVFKAILARRREFKPGRNGSAPSSGLWLLAIIAVVLIFIRDGIAGIDWLFGIRETTVS